MLRLQTISTDYAKLKDPAFITQSENVLNGVAGMKEYATPPQSLKELTEQLLKLAEAVKTMKTGLKAATPERDYLRAQLEAAFKALLAYCTGATPARPDLWAQANFPLTKSGTSPRLPSLHISGLVLADSASSRTLLATADAQPGMYAYAWRIYPKNTTAAELVIGFCYRSCLTREPKLLIDNLDSGTAYGVECAAWNNTGPLQWSPAVFRIVQ